MAQEVAARNVLRHCKGRPRDKRVIGTVRFFKHVPQRKRRSHCAGDGGTGGTIVDEELRGALKKY